MADRDHDERGRGGSRDQGPGAGRDWRGGRDWREQDDRGLLESRYGGPTGRAEPRAFGGGRYDQASDRGVARYEPPTNAGRPGEPERGQAPGGDTAYGQMASGSSDSGLGGYGGADVGGWGQPNLNAQWGQGGYGPLTQGADYGQDGGRFGPQGFDPNAYGPSRGGAAEPHDPHHVSYHHWRSTQLSTHDRDYARWREEQARRYDEDYGSWRTERHSAFSKEFEGWRAGRGGQAGAPSSAQPSESEGTVAPSTVVNPSERSAYGQAGPEAADPGAAHGANPTLARIADGDDGRHHHEKADKAETDRDTPRH